MKKNLKENNAKKNDMIGEIKEEFKRHTGVLMEQMCHEVKTVAEGHSALNTKLNGIGDKLNDVDNRLNKLESNSFKNEMNIESIKSKVGTIDEKVDRIEKELGSVKHAVLDIGQTINGHETRIPKVGEKIHI